MNSSKKALVVWVLVAAFAGAGLVIQYRVGRGEGPIHITAPELDQMIASMPEAQRQQYQSVESKQQFADQIKQLLSLAREARRVGIANRPEVAYQENLQRNFVLAQIYRDRHRDVEISDKEVSDFYASHPGAIDELLRNNPRLGARGGALDERLRKQLAELEILAERARAEKLDRAPGVALQLQIFPGFVLREALLRDLQSNAAVSEDEIQRYYEERKSQYEQVRARHILFSTRPTQAATEVIIQSEKDLKKDAVRRKAEEVLKRARAGEDFAALATQYSEDPGSNRRGGDLQYFGRGQMVSEFEKIAFSLQAGQISELVETPYGFHIIKVEDHRIAPLDENLRPTVLNAAKQQLLAARTKEIEKRYPVTVDVLGAAPPPNSSTGGSGEKK